MFEYLQGPQSFLGRCSGSEFAVQVFVCLFVFYLFVYDVFNELPEA
jgi:hypothetical protein